MRKRRFLRIFNAIDELFISHRYFGAVIWWETYESINIMMSADEGHAVWREPLLAIQMRIEITTAKARGRNGESSYKI